jgi:hypothetical protein
MKKSLLLCGVFLPFFLGSSSLSAQTSWSAWDKTSKILDGDFAADPLSNSWVLETGHYCWPHSGYSGYGIPLSRVYSSDPDAYLHQNLTGLTSGTRYKVTAATDFFGDVPCNGDVHVWLRVYDMSGTLLGEAPRDGGNGWTTLEAIFTAPTNGNVRVQLTGQNYWWEAEAYWDDVKMYVEVGGVWTLTSLIQNGDFELDPLSNGWVLDPGHYHWPGNGNMTPGVCLSKIYSFDPAAHLHQDVTGLTSGTTYKVAADTDFFGDVARNGDVHVWLNVYDSTGTLLSQAQRDGGNGWVILETTFTAPTNGNVRVQLTGQNYWWEAEAYWDNVVLYVDTGRTINERITQLGSLITTATSMGIETGYAQAAIQVAWKFLPFVQEDLASSDLAIVARGRGNVTSLENGLQQQIDSLNNQIQNGVNSYLIVPRPTMNNVTIQNGEFYVGTTPVMIQGPLMWLWEAWLDRTIFGSLGYNSLRFILQPVTIYDDNGYLISDIPWAGFQQNLTAANTDNLYVSTQIFDLREVWDCVARRGYVDIATYRAELQNLVGIFYTNIASGQIDNHIIAVECEGPEFPYETARHQSAYQSWLESQYDTIANYNTICQTSFSSFSQVTFPTSSETNLGRCYDRRMFLNRINADELKYAADLIHSYDPNVKISGYPSYLKINTAGNHTTYNLNPEMKVEAYDICDADTWGGYSTETYAMSTVDWLCMWRDQMCAMGGGSVQSDTEFHPVNSRTSYPDGWLSGMSLQGYIHGMSLSYLWTWVHNEVVDSALLLDAAVCLDASKSALDLRRLAVPIEAFHKMSPDVVFLYSIPSKSSQSYFDQMNRCYEGLFFEGSKPGFITENQVVNDGLSPYKLLIIPSAQYVSNAVFNKIQEFLDGGGTVCLVGNCLNYTERGITRTTQLSSSRLYSYSAFSTIDAARSALRPHLANLNLLPPVIVQVSGTSNRVVEWRYARPAIGNTNYLYVFNTGPNQVTVTTSVTGTDLITGLPVSSSFTLNSLERKIIQFTDTGLSYTLFYDGFESGNFSAGGWQNSGCTIVTSPYYSGSRSAKLNGNDTLVKALSTAGYNNIQLSYVRRKNSYTIESFVAYWSANGGSTWTSLENTTGSSGWGVKTFNLPSSANNNPNFQIKFRVYDPVIGAAYLDEVQIKGGI